MAANHCFFRLLLLFLALWTLMTKSNQLFGFLLTLELLIVSVLLGLLGVLPFGLLFLFTSGVVASVAAILVFVDISMSYSAILVGF